MQTQTQRVDRRQFTKSSGEKFSLTSDVDGVVGKAPLAEIVKFSDNKEIDLFRFPIEKPVMKIYNKSSLLFGKKDGHGHPAPRKFLVFKSLGYLAKALGRQINEDDLKILLYDEGLKLCKVTGKKFRAISWVSLGKVTNEKVKKLSQRGMTLKEMVSKGHIFYSGAFYVPNNSPEFLFVSGVPFPDMNETSPLKKAIERNILPGWGMTSDRAVRLVNRNKKLAHQNEKESAGLNSLSSYDWPSCHKKK